MQQPKNKEEFRAELAKTFSNVLEEKGLSWCKEWATIKEGCPQNGVTKAYYKGVNEFNLTLIAMIKGYTDPRWVTMVQIMDKDNKYHPKEKWHLKRGSQATYVEYWYPFDLIEKKALTWQQYKLEIQKGRNVEEFKLSTRYSAVFNADNVEGMSPLKIEKINSTISVDDLIEKLSKGMNVEILTGGGNQAFYSPAVDKIHLPKPETFENDYAFNSTALHELAHATGHTSRLNRNREHTFGTSAYAYEELVAEMCSCFVGAELEVQATQEHINNHKAYVQDWIKEINDKPQTLIEAIKDAQAAAKYMDYKAGLITEAEYSETLNSVFEYKTSEVKAEPKETSKNKSFIFTATPVIQESNCLER